MIAPVDHLIVKTKLSEKAQVTYKGLTLDLESFDHLKNAVTEGEVVAVPQKLSGAAFTGRPEGVPRYSDPRDAPKENAIRINHIVPEAQVGDIAHFNYKVCQKENFIEIEDDEYFYYKCPYNLVYAVVRDKEVMETYEDGTPAMTSLEVIPIGSYALLLPVDENEDDILHPVPGLPREKWIWTKPQPGRKYLTAEVAYLGKPFTTDPDYDLEVGDVVFLRKFADKEIEIVGEIFYPVRMKDIEFKYLDNVKEFVT